MYSHTYNSVPLITMAQEERLATLIDKLEHAFETDQVSDVTSPVIELYKYEMAAMRHAERDMQVSLEAATNYAVSLQHTLAQSMAQTRQLHRVLFNAQQCLEGCEAEKVALKKEIQEIEYKTKQTHSTQVQEISELKKSINKKEHQIKIYSSCVKNFEKKHEEILLLLNQLKELLIGQNEQLNARVEELTTQKQEMSKVLQGLQESMNEKDQIIEDKN